MFRACPASCGICVNVALLRENGASDEEIERMRNLSMTDFGLWQSIPKDDKNDLVRDRVKRMGEYIQTLEHIGPGTVCNNQYFECAAWAADETADNCKTTLQFMISHCSLACEFCHLVEKFHTCRGTAKPSTAPPFQNVANVRDNLIRNKRAVNIAQGSCSASSPDETGGNDEWVLSLEWKALWNYGPDASAHRMNLVKFLQSKEDAWVQASELQDNFEAFHDGDSPPDRSGQVLRISTEEEPEVQKLLAQMAELLQVPKSNFEVEFVRYGRNERYASHTDFRLHDSWAHSGARVLSVYVALDVPDEGGNFGFPELDWLVVERPEILVWPNVKSGAPENALNRMKNEQLPVVQGRLYAAHIWVRENAYNSSDPCA
jgi:hypothetical protein